MKEYLKNELKHLPMIVIVSIIFCGINTLANNHLFNSKDVDYDNSNTHIESTNVGDAIDELFDAANNFTTYDTRLQGVESKVGTGTLNTTAQNLIGGVNELNSKITTVAAISTGITGVYARKMGKLVKLYFHDFNYNNSSVGTLPDSLKPESVVYCPISNEDSSLSRMMRITTTGQIIGIGTVMSGYSYGSIMYFAN